MAIMAKEAVVVRARQRSCRVAETETSSGQPQVECSARTPVPWHVMKVDSSSDTERSYLSQRFRPTVCCRYRRQRMAGRRV